MFYLDMSDSFRLIGLYLPSEVVDEIDSFVYDEAGVIDVRSYFDDDVSGAVPVGDPLGECFDGVLSEVCSDFVGLYKSVDVSSVDVSELELVRVAARADVVYRFRELVEAIRVLEGCDTQSVHVAMFTEVVSEGYFE